MLHFDQSGENSGERFNFNSELVLPGWPHVTRPRSIAAGNLQPGNGGEPVTHYI
jgi:hypothetical protein